MPRNVALTAFATLLGVWLVASSFFWPHTPGATWNTLLVGLLSLAVSAAAWRRPGARWLYLPLGVWIIASIWLVPLHEHYASWNDVVVGVMLLFIPVAERLLGSGARVAA